MVWYCYNSIHSTSIALWAYVCSLGLPVSAGQHWSPKFPYLPTCLLSSHDASGPPWEAVVFQHIIASHAARQTDSALSAALSSIYFISNACSFISSATEQVSRQFGLMSNAVGLTWLISPYVMLVFRFWGVISLMKKTDRVKNSLRSSSVWVWRNAFSQVEVWLVVNSHLLCTFCFVYHTGWFEMAIRSSFFMSVSSSKDLAKTGMLL